MIAYRFTPLNPALYPEELRHNIIRCNCLGSLFYFIKVALQRHRLTTGLHLPICQMLESERLHDLLEMPRDHFKTTMATEGLPMWRTLPIDETDIVVFKDIFNVPESFIAYMLRVHNRDSRWLLVSENETNAKKLGKRIRWHFESGDVFRALFPEIRPELQPQNTWTEKSLVIPRSGNTKGGAHGEGTFDFIGVGGALQSRHYNGGIIEDDLVGRKAIKSPAVMDDTIEYHQLVVGAFESEDNTHDGNRLIIGNRWGYHDLNSYIREHEANLFRITSHGALGGCCPQHPEGRPIFPEEFSPEKLARKRQVLGPYRFSCQFLNSPVSPEDSDFKEDWLNYFSLYENERKQLMIKHENRDGYVFEDIPVSMLTKAMVCDPNHSGQNGRARHAIVVIGGGSSNFIYLLQTWAKQVPYDNFFREVYRIAQKWGQHKVGFETIAAQRYAAHHLEFLNQIGYEDWYIKTIPLKGEVESEDGEVTTKKEFRIRNIIEPIAESGRLWIQRSQQDFIGEYSQFPHGKWVDLLDAFAYAPQLLRPGRMGTQGDMLLKLKNKRDASKVNQPYSY